MLKPWIDRLTLTCLTLLILAMGCAAGIARAAPATRPADAPTGGVGESQGGGIVTPGDLTSAVDAGGQSRPSVFDPAPLTGTIGTGRPSFGTGTGPVPVGHLQVESGYLYTEDGDSRTHTFPGLLLRYGVYPGMEFRASTTGVIIPEGGDAGTADLRFGAKFAIRKQEGLIPALAFQPSFTVPTGSASTSTEVDPQVQFPIAWAFGRVSVLANLNLGSGSTSLGAIGDSARPIFAHSLLLGYDLTDRVNVYGEYFGVDTTDGPETYNANFGLLYLLNNNNQLDFVVGFGLNDQAPDFFIGAGYSFRL